MSDTSAASMLINFSQSLPGIQTLVILVFGLIGVVLVGSGIVEYYAGGSRFGSASKSSQFSMFTKVFFGSMLLSLFWVMDTVAASFFMETDTLIVDSGVPHDADIRRAVLATTVNLLAVIGYIAGGNGLLTWANGPANQSIGWQGKGAVLVFAGAILTNFVLAVDYIARTFGMSSLGTDYFTF